MDDILEIKPGFYRRKKGIVKVQAVTITGEVFYILNDKYKHRSNKIDFLKDFPYYEERK